MKLKTYKYYLENSHGRKEIRIAQAKVGFDSKQKLFTIGSENRKMLLMTTSYICNMEQYRRGREKVTGGLRNVILQKNVKK